MCERARKVHECDAMEGEARHNRTGKARNRVSRKFLLAVHRWFSAIVSDYYFPAKFRTAVLDALIASLYC